MGVAEFLEKYRDGCSRLMLDCTWRVCHAGDDSGRLGARFDHRPFWKAKPNETLRETKCLLLLG